MLPVWNKGSGKVERCCTWSPPVNRLPAPLALRPQLAGCGLRLSSGDSLGLLCNSGSGTSMSGLASHCMLASLGDDDDLNSRRFTGLPR